MGLDYIVIGLTIYGIIHIGLLPTLGYLVGAFVLMGFLHSRTY